MIAKSERALTVSKAWAVFSYVRLSSGTAIICSMAFFALAIASLTWLSIAAGVVGNNDGMSPLEVTRCASAGCLVSQVKSNANALAIKVITITAPFITLFIDTPIILFNL